MNVNKIRQGVITLRKIFVVAFVTLLATFVTSKPIRAQEKPPAAAPPAANAPSAAAPAAPTVDPRTAITQIAFLFGSWDTSAKYNQTPLLPGGGQATGTLSVKLGPGGYSLIGDFHSADGPEGDVYGHEVITWDATSNAYERYTFGNGFSLPYVSTGTFDGKTLAFDGDFDAGDTKLHLHETYAMSSDGKMLSSESYSTNDAPPRLMLTTSLQKSSAAANSAAGDAAKPPALVGELQKMSFILGKWRYVQTYEKIQSIPEGSKSEGTYTGTVGPGGDSIITDFEESSGPMGGVSAQEIFVWDASQKSYVGYAFVSNTGGCFMRTGKWDQGQLIFTREVTYGSATVHMRYVYTETKSDSVAIQTFMGAGDAPPVLAMTTKATR